MNIVKAACAVVMVAVVCVGTGHVWGQGAPGEPAGVVVLDTFSMWRMSSELGPPMLENGKPADMGCVWLNSETPVMTGEWMQAEFDDVLWNRGPLTLATRSAMARGVYVRGKFTVTNAGAVKGLTLSMSYHGGIAVYVNGTEVGRENLEKDAKLAKGPAGADRNLALAIPTKVLQRGVNVVAIEVRPAAYPSETKDFGAPSAQIISAALSAGAEAVLQACPRRPKGFQVWNADVLSTDLSVDYENASETLRPVVIVGARNGLFSGKVVVGSTEAIKGLKATAGALKNGDNSIPATAVRFRYGMGWGYNRALADWAGGQRGYSPYPVQAKLLDALTDEPLAEYAVDPAGRNTDPGVPVGPAYVPGAVAPVWILVEVPKAAAAGVYRGQVTLTAAGMGAVQVPVEVRVADWTIPETTEWRTWVDMIQSPDSLSLEYNVPLWSEKHFDLIGKSLKVIGESGNRMLYVPLISHTNLGNEESMVRWVKKADGTYEYDFSVMEKYLDTAIKTMGKPQAVVLVAWDIYMMPNADSAQGIEQDSRYRGKELVTNNEVLAKHRTGQPMVTLLDRGTGKVTIENLPPMYDKKASGPLWKPVFDGIRERLKARGLEKTIMLGLASDIYPSKPEVELLSELTGNAPWAVHSHLGNPEGKKIYEIADVGYQARIWTVKYSDDVNKAGHRDKGNTSSLLGWKSPYVMTCFSRLWGAAEHPSVRWKQYPEVCITASVRGPGRIGADYWSAVKDKRGGRQGQVNDRYPESFQRMMRIMYSSLVAPGPNGPVATDHMDAFRDGVQECEARIVIERAITDAKLKEKLGADLAKRCEEFIHARHMMLWLSLSNLNGSNTGKSPNPTILAMGTGGYNVTGGNWYIGSGWQNRTMELFSLAGEVERKIGKQ